MSNQVANFDDIDLDLDPEEELKRVMELVGEGEEPAEEADAESSQEEEKTEETQEDTAEEPSQEPATEPAISEQETALQELREERIRLQQQLNEMSVSALADRRRLESIEKSILTRQEPPAPKEPEGPTPEQIVGLLDQRIAETDAALSKAELEDPSSAPALRQQLRQLERYYNNYVANQTLAQVQAPDPEALVQRSVQETNTQNRFQSVKGQILQEFPIIDTNSEYFNEQLRDQIHEIYNPMLANGLDPTEALVKATMLVTRAAGVKPMSELIKEQTQAEAAKAEAEAKTKAETEKKLASTTRKIEQVSKNVKAAEATPPNLANVGVSGESHGITDKYDFSKMSIKEFNRIPDSELEAIESALMMYG